MDFAITALDCILPGSDSAAHWMAATKPAIRPVSAERFATSSPHDADQPTSMLGAWVDVAENSEHPLSIVWTRRVLQNALDDAMKTGLKPGRTDLFLANLSLPSAAAVHGRAAARGLGDAVPAFEHSFGPARDAADFFRLRSAVTLDAACASGLYAVRLAMDALASGRCDAAVAAGVQACDPRYLLVGFSKLLALSASGTPYPLDARANGLVVGEGAAAIVLKRLPDALAANDRIHAVIRGGGLGNDGRKGNMLAPDSAGQHRAMHTAWSTAGLDPATLGYVECHATGTKVGDAAELRSLAQLLDAAGTPKSPVAVGSAKGLIGHTITTAGLAGLLRAVGAVRDGRIPVGPAQPHAELEASKVLRSSAGESWSGDRRAAVSAFGFGGTNAHLILDAPPARPEARRPAAPPPTPEPTLTGFGIRAGLRRILQRDRPTAERPAPAPEPRQLSVQDRAELVETPRLTVTGVGGQVGTYRDEALFDALSAGRSLTDASGRASVSAVHLDPRQWRIPPLELAEVHPQQLLAMQAGADALERAGLPSEATVGVVFGMQLDSRVCDPVLRIADPAAVPDVPPLTAPRVQGQLPNFVANRLSAQRDLEGPSYTVSAGAASGLVAIQHAARLLATKAVDAVVVGAVDAEGSEQGAVAFVLQREADTSPDARLASFELGMTTQPDAGASMLAPLVELLQICLDGDGTLASPLASCPVSVAVSGGRRPDTSLQARNPVLQVPNDAALSAHDAGFGPGDPAVRLPAIPVPHNGTHGWSGWLSDAPESIPPAPSPLPAVGQVPPSRPTPRAPVSATGATSAPSTPAAPLSPTLLQELAGLGDLAGSLARANDTLADAHDAWLQTQQDAAREIARLGAALQAFDPDASVTVRDATAPVAPASPPPAPARPTPQPIQRHVPPTSFEPPRQFDRAALEVHASGKLSEVFGPSFADQDRFEPRTRMPEAPMLLCSRVVDIDGTPGELGPSRIVTEYDLPTDASWSHHDGKPNACVIVESGQADLFLVSFLGIEAHCRGERVYRLLDCDLTFHGQRPQVGETLHHDIRIKRFARLGGTILFYFEYDCTSNTDGRKVLSMRNGCAGFFTPEELATPQGVDPDPPPLANRPAPAAPLRATAVTLLDETGVQACVEGRFSDAFGPGFSDADGSWLTLPDSEWRLAHRIEEVRTSGGPYGLGLARFEQVLRDDDWFNPCHFKGDPCMPGTLMLEGCLQAVQVWLTAAGLPATHRVHRFEPLPELPFELRCRGQVVPGHSSLTYEARIKEAVLTGETPYAIADVLLCVDGTPVVLAKNVGVTVGVRDQAPPALRDSTDNGTSDATGPTLSPVAAAPSQDAVVDRVQIYEYSIGNAENAFGPHYREYAGESPRCARMPGPPLLQMTRVVAADRPFELRQGAEVAIEYDVPPDAWYFATTPGTSMPFAILLETALQPCGWLTAWQAAGIKSGRDLYFRNLGGEATQFVEIWPEAGTLTTRTRQTVVAESAGLLIHKFDLTVHAGEQLVYECTTSFGYFTASALDGQKGLGLKDEDRRAAERSNGSGRTVDLRAHPSMPRDDWRNLDEVAVINETGGKAGLGFYEGVKHIDPDEWFFTAHFFLDPVMPGSLGLEAALQLARFVLEDRTGRKARVTPIRLDTPHVWKYRGQIRRPIDRMTLELEVTSLSDDEIVFDAVLRGDGMPIYELIDFGVRAVPHRAEPLPAPPPPRGPHSAALLDEFVVDGPSGTGRLRLDPARFPWLADHCPTVTAPALPMAFAAEIAAEAALLLSPGSKVVGVPMLEAEKWIHTGDGPLDLLVVAVQDGPHVAVSLAVHVDNPRFPKLSGPKVHMKAVVELGDAYPVSPTVRTDPASIPGATRVPMSIEDYYGGGLTFHGPTLQGMTDLGFRSRAGALATFRTKPDSALNGAGEAFVLDPLLLDTATHPMVSGEPELWSDAVGAGKLAYPVKAEQMRFYGPRPEGEVACRLDLMHADAHTLAFDVALVGTAGVWCTFRWVEALVPGGPVLGHDTPTRKAFVWDGLPVPEVSIGARNGGAFEVSTGDLVEPIEGTLVGLCCTQAEQRAYRKVGALDRRDWALKRFAAKGAVRAWLQDQLRDVHPRDVDLLEMRVEGNRSTFIVVGSSSLTAQELIDLLGPTHTRFVVELDGSVARGWRVDVDSP